MNLHFVTEQRGIPLPEPKIQFRRSPCAEKFEAGMAALQAISADYLNRIDRHCWHTLYSRQALRPYHLQYRWGYVQLIFQESLDLRHRRLLYAQAYARAAILVKYTAKLLQESTQFTNS